MAPRNGPNAVRRTAAVSRDFQAAFEHHQAGNLDQAEALYRKALRKAPDHSIFSAGLRTSAGEPRMPFS